MLNGFRIALIEDDDIMGRSLVQRLELEGASVVWMRHISRAIGALRTPRAPIDAVICDIRLPDGSGEDLFYRLHETTSPPPFLFVTGHGGIEQAVRLMRAGAADYVTKPFDMPVLLDRLVMLLRQAPQDAFPPLLGVSAAARKVETLARNAAHSNRNTLIIGGPGTGKGLIARRIHEQSDQRAAPFVAVNLAREPDAATALFGAGATLEQVGQGILYLNALSLLAPDAQHRLIKAQEAGFSGRIIASCGHEISEIRARGGMAAELLYRLDMLEIPISPLKERPEDALWLMAQLFEQMNARRPQALDGVSRLSEDAVRAHDWAGGGRELRSRLAQGVATASGPLLQPGDLFPERVAGRANPVTLAEARETAEKRFIIEALEQCDGQIGKAATALKVSRTTLWDKMQKYGIGRETD